jgi:hypothetical protein
MCSYIVLYMTLINLTERARDNVKSSSLKDQLLQVALVTFDETLVCHLPTLLRTGTN